MTYIEIVLTIIMLIGIFALAFLSCVIKSVLECYGVLVYISELFGGMTLQNILREDKY